MMLAALILVPLAGVLLIGMLPRLARHIALLAMCIESVLGVLSLGARVGMRWEEHAAWARIGDLAIAWHMGVDGLSHPLVLLTIVLGVVAVCISRREVATREAMHYAILLGLVGAVIGVFASLDLVLFFVFWEIVLVSMFLLILIWGHANRAYAAMKFLVYTGVGSAALLLAIILIATGGSVDVTQLSIAPGLGALVFGLVLFACMIKMPIVPFHTWLPDAHVEAPTAGSVLLAGVLLKMGAYALLRIGAAVLPDPSNAIRAVMIALGIITIVFAAFVCLAQTHLKRLIAYSSITHMGLILVALGIGTPMAITGAVVLMVTHGLTAALLFGLAGVIHQAIGSYDLAHLRGLASRMPRTAWLLVASGLAGMGVPLTGGFVAELLVLAAGVTMLGVLGLVPLLGVVLGGAYMVRMLGRVVWGETRARAVHEPSLFVFLAVFGSVLLIGILPMLLLGLIGGVAW